MNSSITKKEIKETTYGRPRLLSHEGILESAVELGLEGLTMKRLSNHLNVGTGYIVSVF
jgi:hypothetical protein